jgi:hypothetical protein
LIKVKYQDILVVKQENIFLRSLTMNKYDAFKCGICGVEWSTHHNDKQSFNCIGKKPIDGTINLDAGDKMLITALTNLLLKQQFPASAPDGDYSF